MPGPVPGIRVFFLHGAKTWMAGHRRAEATPSFRRLCPAMTKNSHAVNACAWASAEAKLAERKGSGRRLGHGSADLASELPPIRHDTHRKHPTKPYSVPPD